jgi:hypothetical protein
VIQGALEIEGETGGELWLNGLLVNGALTLNNAGGSGLARLHVAHTTLVPSAGGVNVGTNSDALSVELVRSLCGAVTFAGPARSLRAVDSAIDAGEGEAVMAVEV